MKKIGFIGIGVMGQSIVSHLLRAGYPVVVYTRTWAKAEGVLAQGATWADNPKALTEAVDIVMTMVGYPSDVEEVYEGEQGIFAGSRPGQYLVDLTTSTPALAERLYEKGKSLGLFVCDAPVSGGDIGAREGTLTVMVGSEPETFDALLPVLEVFSSRVKRQGNAGAGQHTKMANQIMIAGTMTGLTEMMLYASKAGLSVADVIETVSAGSGANRSMTAYAPRILIGDYSPGFFAKHFLKDLSIALNEAERMGLNLPATQLAKQLYQQLIDAGHGDDGTQALIKLWETTEFVSN